MRILFTGAAVAALALSSTAGAGATSCTMNGMMSHPMPKCTTKTGPVVWFRAPAKTFYMKGSSHYGKGMGMYVCRATAVARGGHAGMAGMMGGSHGMMGGSHGSAMPITQTMAPRPMSSGNPSPHP